MKKFWVGAITSWQSSLLMAVIGIAIIGLFTFHLGRLTGGFHAQEVANYRHVPSFLSLLKDPLNAPYYFVRNTVHKLGIHNVLLLTRGISVFFGLLTVTSFYSVMRRWHTLLVAGLASVLFAASHLVLRTSRLGLPTITQLLPLIMFALWFYLPRFRYQRILLSALIALYVSLMYVPGMAWLLLAGLIWQHRAIKRLLSQQDLWLKPLFLIGRLAGLAPLVYALVRTPRQIWNWLDIYQPLGLHHVWQTASQLPATIAFHSQAGPLITVGHAPLLDICSVCLVVIGLYSTATNWTLERSKLTIGFLLLASLRIIIGGPSGLIFMLIPLYFLIAEGLAYMLALWFAVFPRNPLARGTATALLTVVVGLAAYYHVANYYVAWPQSPTTKAVFSQHL